MLKILKTSKERREKGLNMTECILKVNIKTS